MATLLTAAGDSPCSSLPLGRVCGLEQSVGGLGEFISSIRAQFGSSGDLASRYGE